MHRTLAVLLALLLALDAPCACAAKQLGYAVLLSEGPDKPNAAGQTVAWGSYHITITGKSSRVPPTWLNPSQRFRIEPLTFTTLQDICHAREATPRATSLASRTAALL